MRMVRNGVHRLIWLNIVSAVVVGVTTIADEKFELINTLAGLAFFFCLLGLGAANVVGIFLLWKNHSARAFLPIASYICCVVAMVCGIRLGVSVVMANTLVKPDTFLNSEVRRDLEGIAAQLHGHGLKDFFRDRSGVQTIHTVDEQTAAQLPSGLLNRLNRYKLDSIFVDDTQSLVVFSGNHDRTWYHYLYAAGGLEPAYCRPSTITKVDIESWRELSKIIRQGPVASENERMQIAFEPSIAYSTLEGALSKTALGALRETGYVTTEEKTAVISALNQQRLSASRLIESPSVTYVVEDRPYLCLGCKISDSFWVTKLLQKLVRDGTIFRAEDNRHLRIKNNLTKIEEREVEWLHVGMMNFLYGNLLHKRDHHYSRDLGGGWYFERD